MPWYENGRNLQAAGGNGNSRDPSTPSIVECLTRKGEELLVGSMPPNTFVPTAVNLDLYRSQRFNEWECLQPFVVSMSRDSGETAMMTSFLNFLIEESKTQLVDLILTLPPRYVGNRLLYEKGDAFTFTTRYRSTLDSANIKLAGWQVRDPDQWWTQVNAWYRLVTGKDKYEEAAFFMMLRRNGFRAWNLAVHGVSASGFDNRLRRIDTVRHGYVFDTEVQIKYGSQSRKQSARDRADRHRERKAANKREPDALLQGEKAKGRRTNV